jgi:hypothetical protein
MPKKLKKFEFTRGSQNYDWEAWCNGDIWELEIGKDFKSELHIFRAAFSGQCKKRNLTGRTQTDGKFVIVQATKLERTATKRKSKKR